MMGRRLALLLLLPPLFVGGCHRGATTPEEAFGQVERAIMAQDGVTLYRYLDRSTQWAIDAAYKDQQLMRTIIRAKYPEEEQARALQPLQAAAEPDAAHYFARAAANRGSFETYRRKLDAVAQPPPIPHVDGASAVLVAGLHFVRDVDGSWGLSDLGPEWALEKDRASHGVKTVRENAALYKKANDE
jgi:hypothetical protein